MILGEFSTEFKLMLACADSKALTCNVEKIKALLALSIDWDEFLQMVIHHRVYPLVYKTLSSLDETVLPDAIASVLQQKNRENIMQSLRFTGAAVALVNSLEKAAIPSVVLKGPALAQRLYSDVALRPFKDIDLFVWPEDLEQACYTLEQLGYIRTNPDFPFTPVRHRWYLRQYHHFTYCHSGHKTSIELHWETGLALPTAGNIKKDQVGVPFPVLSDEEWFIYLVYHGAQHSWFRLRWLCDIAEFSRQELDWERIRHLAEQHSILPIFHQSLILANQLLDIAVPELFQEELAKDKEAWQLAQMATPFFLDVNYEPGNKRRKRDWRLFGLQQQYNFKLQRSLRQKLSYMMSLVSPTENDIRQFSLPDSLFYGYYLVRPFTWLYRRTNLLKAKK